MPKHIEFYDDYVIIYKFFVPKSETDVYREGNYIYISKTATKYCLF